MNAGGCPRVYLSTGESSGDLHGAALARALLHRFPEATIDATGGAHLARAGIRLRHSIADCGALGGIEILNTIPRHVALLADLDRRFRSGMYDLVVLVDYPGFHIRVARAATRAGIPVLYYIAPQLWAWGAGRAATLKRGTRELAVILPFEEPFFRQLGIPATFVGHPLLDQPSPPSRAVARQRLGLGDSTSVLGIFPGSRKEEVRRMWPVFREAALEVRRAIPNLSLVVAGFAPFDYPDAENFLIHTAAADEVFAASDAALCKSGTTTLQAALAGVPMVIAYRVHPVTHFLARRAIRISHIGLVNLVAGHGIAPEFLQDAATPQALASAVLPLLDPGSRPARDQRSGFAEVRSRLGSPGAAERVAQIAARLVA